MAHTQNGPLSLTNLSGAVEATAANGAIRVDGGSGTMKVRASNVHLSTVNGPITIKNE